MRTEYRFNPPPYSLHDLPVRFVVDGDQLTLVTEYGVSDNSQFSANDSWRIEIRSVDWFDSCVDITTSKEADGSFSGKRVNLSDLLKRCPDLRFDVMTEQFGVNRIRLRGRANIDGEYRKITVEIYHAGNIGYVIGE